MQNWEHGAFAQKDINFIVNNNLCPPSTVKFLENTMNETSNPYVCLEHRRIQEVLKINYDYYSDKQAWNTNNQVIHNFYNQNVSFN